MRKDKKVKRPSREEVMKTVKNDIFKPIKIEDWEKKTDPCFGQLYDLSTKECKMCGDSEICCISTANYLGKTRKELEEANNFKDLDDRIDKVGVKKYFRGLKRKEKSKKEIITAMQDKYQLTLKETRQLYREFNN